MSYNKNIWKRKDKITKERMNNIENGIYDAHDKIDAINNKAEENTTNTNTARKDISDIKLQIGTEELTTTSKKIKGAINELGSQIKDNANEINFIDKIKMKYIYRAKALGGNVDDGDAIINALNNEDIVYLPKGRYEVLNNIVIPSNKTLIGEKGSVIYFNQPDADNSHILVTQGNNITIDGVELEGNTSYSRNSFGILVNGVQPTSKINDITIKNCIVKNTSSAGIVAREVKNIIIENCYVENTNRDGIQLTGCENFLVTNCKTNNTGDDAIASHGGYIDGYCYGLITNNIIKNSNIARGISSAGGQDIIISNNLIDGFGQTGIMILRDSNFGDGNYVPKNININNNTIINRTDDMGYLGGTCGIYLYQEINSEYISNITINSNTIYSKAATNLMFGIRFNDYVKDVLISNNIIESVTTFQFGSNTQNILIDSNKIKSNCVLNCWGDGSYVNDIKLCNNKCLGTNNGNKLFSVNGLVKFIVNGNDFKDYPEPCDKSSLRSIMYNNVLTNVEQIGIGFVYDETSKDFTEF